MRNYWLIPKLTIAVEIDGSYQCPQQLEKQNLWYFLDPVYITGYCVYNGLDILYSSTGHYHLSGNSWFRVEMPDDLYSILMDYD